MPRQFVRCCGDTEKYDLIYYFDDVDAPGFCYNADDAYIQYCPFCGVMLDTNLPMTDEKEDG